MLPAVHASPQVTPDAEQRNKPVSVALNYVLSATSLGTQSNTARRLQYISSATTQITIGVTPFGGTTTNYGPTACTVASCAVSFTANPGAVTLQFTLSDGSADVLSTFNAVAVIQPGILNTLSFTANPVVDSVQLQLASSATNGGTPASIPLSVRALDAVGNVIAVSGNYVDVNGRPLSLILQVRNNQNGGSGTVTLQGPSRISAPGQAATLAIYDGKWLADSAISVTSTSSAITSLSGATLTITPTIIELLTLPTLSRPHAIIDGQDGNLYFTQLGGVALTAISTSGVPRVVNSAVVTGNGLTLGADGNFWHTNYANSQNSVTKVTRTGSVLATYTMPLTNSHPEGVAVGPDGAVWIAGSSMHAIFRIDKLNNIQTFPLPTADLPTGITVGADGALWFGNDTGNTIGRLTITGVYSETALPTAGSRPTAVALGPDGNIWFTEFGNNMVGTISPRGVILNEYLIPTASSAPKGICAGPDGAMWFVEQVGGKIGRVTLSGNLSEYPLASLTSQPFDITTGPDGNIWITEFLAGKIAKLVF